MQGNQLQEGLVFLCLVVSICVCEYTQHAFSRLLQKLYIYIIFVSQGFRGADISLFPTFFAAGWKALGGLTAAMRPQKFSLLASYSFPWLSQYCITPHLPSGRASIEPYQY